MPGRIEGYVGVYEDSAGIVDIIDYFDRPPKAFCIKGGYAGSKAFGVFLEDKPGKRIPKAELSSHAGIFHACAEVSISKAEVKGPNVYAGIKAHPVHGVEAMAKAELASASSSAGPLKLKAALAVDTGFGISPTGLETKVLGTGFSIGRKMGISVFGSGFEINLW